MSENPKKKEMKTKPVETEKHITSQKESGSSEKAQTEQSETTERSCENIINKVKDIEMGALFAGVESLFDSALSAYISETKSCSVFKLVS